MNDTFQAFTDSKTQIHLDLPSIYWPPLDKLQDLLLSNYFVLNPIIFELFRYVNHITINTSICNFWADNTTNPTEYKINLISLLTWIINIESSSLIKSDIRIVVKASHHYKANLRYEASYTGASWISTLWNTSSEFLKSQYKLHNYRIELEENETSFESLFDIKEDHLIISKINC